MTLIDPKEIPAVQTRNLPMTSLDQVKDHVSAVRTLFSWNAVGVLNGNFIVNIQ